MEEILLEVKKVGENVADITKKADNAEKEAKQATTAAKEAKEAAEAAQKDIKEAKKSADDAVAATNKLQTTVEETQKSVDQILVTFNSSDRATQKQKSFDEILKSAIEEKTDDFAKLARKEIKRVEVELKDAGTVTTGNVTGSNVWGAIQRPGIIEAPKRKVHIRQLLAGGSIGAGTDFYFMRQNGDGEGNPAAAAENTTKAQFDIDLVESSVKIETIAGWMKVTRKAMNNIPGFVSFLQSRLPERLLRVEDELALYGDGNSPNWKGILTAGNYVASTSAEATLVERIIDDVALLEDTYEREATSIVLRPVNYYGFFKNKAAGSGEFDLPKNVTFVNGVLYISGIPVYATTALHNGDYIVGDFAQGAQMLMQEGMRMEFFEQDDKNAQQNLVTVRIEETGCLPVYGNDYFIKGAVPDEA